MDNFIGKWSFPQDESLLEQSARRGEVYDFGKIADDIIQKVGFQKEDTVLDVCCGNAALTKRIAPHCKKIHGVDFSKVLIRTAEKIKKGENVANMQLHLSDALKVDELFEAGTFDKAYCYFSFQYFNEQTRELLLEKLLRVTKPDGSIFIGDIPDKTRRWKFYNSPLQFYREKISRLLQFKEGECDLGWWIDPAEITEWCKRKRLNVTILSQNNLPHAHYRFDVLIKNNK